MIRAERDGKKLKFLTKQELKNAVIDIMSEVKLITGALVHAEDENRMMSRQVEMIQRFLFVGFGMLTKKEIIQAFYLNSQGYYEDTYRHYNKELNAEFFGDVLRAYLKYKLYVRETMGPLITKVLQLGGGQQEKREVDYPFWQQLIQEEYDCYRKGLSCYQLWSSRKYYTLRKFGLLPFSKGLVTWVFFFKKVMKGNIKGTRLPEGADISRYQFTAVSQAAGIFHNGQDYKRCMDFLRRYAYWYVLKACADCGINDLFKEIANDNQRSHLPGRN
jgi:hypothetical protein